MAGASQPNAVLSPGPRQSWEGPLGALGWGLAWLDYGIYKVEYAAVVSALAVMTVVEFIYILSIYVTEQRINFMRMSDPDLEAESPVGLIVLLLFMMAMMAAIVNNTPLGIKAEGDKRPVVVRVLATVGLLLGVCGVAYLSIWFEESSSFFSLLTLFVMVPMVVHFVRKKETTVAIGMGVATVATLYGAQNVPSGFSWADSFALFLLLWVGFLGASMAAKAGRHLKVDAARKIWPKAIYHRLNGVSDLVAAGFCGLLTYVGYLYLFHEDYGRFWTTGTPGEIPDWIKSAAIPFAFLLMALRMGARGLVRLIWGKKYEKEELDPLAALANVALELDDDTAERSTDDADEPSKSAESSSDSETDETDADETNADESSASEEGER